MIIIMYEWFYVVLIEQETIFPLMADDIQKAALDLSLPGRKNELWEAIEIDQVKSTFDVSSNSSRQFYKAIFPVS